MFTFSKQEKLILLLIIFLLIFLFGWQLYQNNASSIIIEPTNPNQETEVNQTISQENAKSNKSVKTDFSIIHITGAVQNPGVYQLEKGQRIIDAVQVAGGQKENANLDAVNLAAHIHDGQKIVIPYQAKKSEITDNNTPYPTENQTYSELNLSNNTNGLININCDSMQRLTELSGIGNVLAKRIVEYRQNHGNFSCIEEIKAVSGIGEKKYENIKELITVY